MSEPKLALELVPKSAWHKNVRSEVSKSKWDVIRKKCYRMAGNVCEVCGGVGAKHPVECHEVWSYDDELHTQTLVALVAVCPPCHKATHMGLSRHLGIEEESTAHLAKVNGWTIATAKAYIEDEFLIWEERSKHAWALDISFIDTYGKSATPDTQEFKVAIPDLTTVVVGDTVLRMLCGTIPMVILVTEITGGTLICGAWQFDIATGCEIDEDLDFGPPPKMTGSFITEINPDPIQEK